MRILIITQYFWPENFVINDVVLALKKRGHNLTVLTGKPNYPKGKFYLGYRYFSKRIEYWNGIKIIRVFTIPRGNAGLFGLFFNYSAFAFFGSLRLFFIKSKFDKILIFQPSPISVGIPAIFAKYWFRAPLYFWVQDLWPESVRAAGGINNHWVIYFLESLTKFIYRHTHKVLVQSRAFIPYIINQNISESKIFYLPNTAPTYYKELSADSELLKVLPSGVKLMFAGNIGESQSFETLVQAAFLLKSENIDLKWLIIGDGRMKRQIELRVKELNLEDTFIFLGSHSPTEMPRYFSCADALLVSLKGEPIFGYTIPSKIQSYLACGRPILASLSGEGARIIIEAKAGFVSEAEDPLNLSRQVKLFLGLNEVEKLQMGKNAREYFEREFELELLVDRLELIFE